MLDLMKIVRTLGPDDSDDPIIGTNVSWPSTWQVYTRREKWGQGKGRKLVRIIPRLVENRLFERERV